MLAALQTIAAGSGYFFVFASFLSKSNTPGSGNELAKINYR